MNEDRMKIIWVTDECPYPPNTGGRVGVWKRIEYLSKRNEIYLFTIIDNEDEKKYYTEMLNWCKEVYMFERCSTFRTLAYSLFYPYPGASRWSTKIRNQVEEMCSRIHPDYVFVDGPHMMGTLKKNVLLEQNIVLNQHNIEHLSLKSIGQGTSNILKKILYYLTSMQMKRYEKCIYLKRNVNLYTFVSSSDKEYFEKKYQLFNTLLVPVGAEINFSDIKPGVHSIIFVAKMSYQSNEDGAVWLLEKIWDKIHSLVKDAKLYLVGKDPSNRLKEIALQHEGVVITGTVDSIEEYYDKTNLVVVPILAGGGVKVKLLEALGHGKIVVTTKKGIEGTDIENGKHLISTDDETKFIETCVEILNNPNSFEKMHISSMKKMRNDYSWESVINAFEKVLREKGSNI